MSSQRTFLLIAYLQPSRPTGHPTTDPSVGHQVESLIGHDWVGNSFEAPSSAHRAPALSSAASASLPASLASGRPSPIVGEARLVRLRQIGERAVTALVDSIDEVRQCALYRHANFVARRR